MSALIRRRKGAAKGMSPENSFSGPYQRDYLLGDFGSGPQSSIVSRQSVAEHADMLEEGGELEDTYPS